MPAPARLCVESAGSPAPDERREAEENFRLMLDSVTDCAIIMLDEEGRVKSWNAGARRIKGYDADEIVGQPIDCFFTPEEIAAGKPARALQQAAATGRFEDDGWRVRRDGTKFWANAVITPIRDSGRVLRGYANLERDVTLQKHTDDALRNSEAQLRSILDTVPDAIVIIDEDGLIKSFSGAASQLFQYSADEAIGRNVRILMAPSYREPHDEYLARYRRTGLKRIIGIGRTVQGMRRDGTVFPMELAVGEAVGGGQRLFTGFVRDITERQRVEAELTKARATAEAANNAKSEFLSSMSHELRTPLNAILGFAQLMASDSPAPTPIQMASIDQILQAGWYLLTLIDEILDLSAIESGKQVMNLDAVSLAEVFVQCRSMLEPLAQKRGITMQFPAFDTPCYIMADRTRLRQVFVNLLTNAIKYNRTNGTIAVECVEQPDRQIRIGVRDTGMGLTPERISKLYQPFNRLGQEAGGEQGTGIGLVVTKRLVEAMGGTVGVESEVGTGTVFWVNLLVAGQAQRRQSNSDTPSVLTPAPHYSVPARTILYAEDNPANLKLVELLISRRSDLRLLSAENGDQAIEMASACLPDVILMDIHLPGTSGLKALTILRAKPATAHIPIIALSANASPRDVEYGLAAGFQSYLTKPIKVDELMETLDLALSRTPPLPSPAPQAA